MRKPTRREMFWLSLAGLVAGTVMVLLGERDIGLIVLATSGFGAVATR